MKEGKWKGVNKKSQLNLKAERGFKKKADKHKELEERCKAAQERRIKNRAKNK